MNAESTREYMPVTPQVITWARVKAGYSLDDAKQYFRKIAEWESEASRPTYPQLEAMADKFKVPVAVFFFPEPPKMPPVSETFRTIPEYEFGLLPKRIRTLLYKAKVFQISLAELNNNHNPAPSLITRDITFTTQSSMRVMAKKVRKLIGISLEEQFSWNSPDQAFKRWREALSNVGIYVFKDAFRQDEYCGFCLYDDEFPIIYVNNSTHENRQIFTLFHELSHLIFHTSGIDPIEDSYINRLPNNEKKIEVICNRFAGKFLVPDDAFIEDAKHLKANATNVSQLAAKYSVSRHVIYRKYLDEQLISEMQYRSAVAKIERKPTRKDSSGNYYNNIMAYLGKPYIKKAFEGYYQGRYDKLQLADYLDMKPLNIPNVEERLLRAN